MTTPPPGRGPGAEMWRSCDRALVEAMLARRSKAGGPLLVGLSGGQGSGKSTTAARLVERLQGKGKAALALSLDDFYLTRAEREDLARRVHPLFQVRGVPGTHDIGLAVATLAALARAAPGERTSLPRFDKANDERLAIDLCPTFAGRPDIVILEGWCIGAAAQDEADLRPPVNVLEATRDADAVWRRYSNEALRDGYANLFALLDFTVFFRAPSFDRIFDWRLEQEEALARGASGSSIMSREEVGRFVAHYERITRALIERPRADIIVDLDEDRRPVEIRPSDVGKDP